MKLKDVKYVGEIFGIKVYTSLDVPEDQVWLSQNNQVVHKITSLSKDDNSIYVNKYPHKS